VNLISPPWSIRRFEKPGDQPTVFQLPGPLFTCAIPEPLSDALTSASNEPGDVGLNQIVFPERHCVSTPVAG
jgi:hypothetical protein